MVIFDFVDRQTMCCMTCARADGCRRLVVHRSYFVNPFIVVALEAFGFGTSRFELAVLCCFCRRSQGWCRSRLCCGSRGSEVDRHPSMGLQCCCQRSRQLLRHRMLLSLRLRLGGHISNWTWYWRCTSYFLILCLWNCIYLRWLALRLSCSNRSTFSFAKDFAAQLSTCLLQKPTNSAGQPLFGSSCYLAPAKWTNSSSC